ncbi:DUF6314 family protein [Streptomyces sp. URMC 123]|uniref:DUF6314 family protein n=1 Tax=Streptomyces sp. URMC 123 TaxID=3423403 RepID=UPI003F1DF421
MSVTVPGPTPPDTPTGAAAGAAAAAPAPQAPPIPPTPPVPPTSPTAYPVPDAAAHLAGRWTVDRVLRDLATGTHGSFRGTADFTPAPDGDGCLLHIEDGELDWAGARGRAGRTLRLLPAPDGTAEVTFADGRPFHDLDLRTGHWTTRHPCGPDVYDGTFTVLSADTWRVSWRVTGRAKDQLLTTVYRRR